MIKKITTAEARKNFADVVNNVAYGKDTVVLTRRRQRTSCFSFN
jgi:antitoxin Phd